MASESAATGIINADWGTGPNGEIIKIHTLKNRWMEVRLTEYGARMVSVKTADRDGKIADVILGYDSLREYLADTKTFWARLSGAMVTASLMEPSR